MSRKSAWSSSPGGQGRRFDLAPPGFVAFYKMALWGLVFGGAMALPLALTGVFGALAFDDFGTALRIAMGVGGASVSAVCVWLPAKMLIGATALRSRVTVTRAGVLVETGVSSVRAHVWLTPLDAVSADEPKTDELARGGIVLAATDQSMRVAVGYDGGDRQLLLKAIRVALTEAKAGTKQPPSRPRAKPLGPAWPERARQLGRDIARPLRHPTPYLLVDLGAIVGTSALTWLLDEVIDWRDAYPIAFALFIAGLAARRYDGTYVAGLRHYLRDDDTWSMRYMAAGVCIAMAGTGGMAPRLTIGPAFIIAMTTAIGLHWVMLRHARGDATPKPNRSLDMTLAMSLVPISILHEAAMFEFVVDTTQGLAVMSLAIVPVTVLFAYVPVRLHAFVDDPGDRSNVAWFWLTAIWLALGPIIAIAVALVREI